MYLLTQNRGECCGCGACQQICPTDAIAMTFLDDGFLYPVVDESRCIHCEKCIGVCPIHQMNNLPAEAHSHHCFYGWHRDEGIRMQSTSGGAFSALAELMLAGLNGTVYGAVYDNNWGVRHIGTNRLHELKQLRQSKYIQSEAGGCYSEIRDRLDAGGSVLFCGTPCQVDGLRRFLGKDYGRLVLVDLVCHGVTSPIVFKKYIKSVENKFGAKVTFVRFRDKITKRNISSLSYTTISLSNGRKFSSECNLYLRAYMSGLMQRACCERCPYANDRRKSDVTLGDFWGIEEILPHLKSEFHKGISLILANSEKGLTLCKYRLSDRMTMVETDVSYAFNGINRQLEQPVAAHKRKQQFYSDVARVGVRKALANGLGMKYLILLYFRCLLRSIIAVLPRRAYKCMVFLKGRFQY